MAWDVSGETPEGQARALLADLLDWHRREDKPAWWRYLYLRTLSPAELTGEPDALGGLTGGEMAGQVTRPVVRRFRFPGQEHKCTTGGTAGDPDTDKQWSVCDMDGGHLLDGDLVGGRGAARAGLPLRPAPAERRHLTGQGPGHHRGQPRSHPGVLPDPAPDGPGQCPAPGLGNGQPRRAGSASSGHISVTARDGTPAAYCAPPSRPG